MEIGDTTSGLDPAGTPQPETPPAINYDVPSNLMPVFEDASKRSGVPMNILLSTAKQESDFGRNTSSPTSSAKGIFQFTDGTWADTIQKSGPIYGIPTTASVNDPTANIYMGAEFARQNANYIKTELGRAAKPGEYYVTHFLGRQGGVDLIKANESSPNASAAALFPKAANANRSIFYDKAGAPRTVSQVYGWLSGIVDGKKTFTASGSPIDFGPKLTPQMLAPPPLPPSQVDVMNTEAAMAHREAQAGFINDTSAAFQDTLTGRILSTASMPDFAPDPNFKITHDDLQAAREAGVSEDYLPRLGNAVSKPNMDWLIKTTLAEQGRTQQLSDAGWEGTGLRLVTSLLDPVSVATGVATGGLGDLAAVAAGAGKVGRVVAQASAGAAANTAIDQGLNALGDPESGQHALRTAALGALFGSAFGALSRNPFAATENRQIQNAASGLKRQLETSTSLIPAGSTVGAAANPHVDMPYLNDKDWAAISGADVPHAAMGKVRWSNVAQMKSSPNPGVRLMGILGEDAVGGSKESKFTVNPISAEQEQERFHRVWLGDFRNTYRPAFDAWAEENGYNAFQRIQHGEEFGNQVWEYVHDWTPPQGGWPKSIQQLGEKIKSQNAEVLRVAQNPLLPDGGAGRPIAGFEDVPENPFYMARIHSAKKWNDTIETYSEKGAMEWWKGAIRSAQPDIEDDLLDAMSRGIVRNSYKRANHLDEGLNLMLAGKDFDGLAAMLRDENVSEDRITNFLARIKKKEASSATDVRAKKRVFLDEKYRLPYPKRNSAGPGEITLKDFVHTDATNVHPQYLRHMAGRVALGRVRLKNPTTGDMLVDGITSDHEFAQVKSKVVAMAADARTSAEQNATDQANMQWMYDRVLGRPDPSQFHKFATYSRLLRKFNFIRVMGQVGFSQIQDFSSAIGQLGLKAAITHMPAFRRVLNMKGEEVLRHGLDRELEAIGIAVDPMRGMQHFRNEDAAPMLEGRLGKVDNYLNLGSRVMSHVSGMDLVNTGLMRMVGKGIVQKFADLAHNPTKANMQRMASLGLDADMLKRVLAQTKHFTKVDGVFFNNKVTHMNLDKWDAEPRAAFENAVFRWSRRIVQENDYGAAHRWSSSPLWQMLFQFRNFTLTAWEKQFLHNVHMKDMSTFHMAWMSMAMAAATYAVRTQLNAIGRGDKADYLKKRLSPANLAGAAFQMAGWSSILPMVWDTASMLGGANPWFDFRSSQQPTNVLTGNPTGDLFDTLGFAMRGLTQSTVQHRSMSQQELRYWQRLAPFGTWMPFVPIFNSLISGHPKYAPRN